MTILPVVSAVAAIVLYAHSLGNGFAFDDYYMVQTNEAVHSFDDLPGMFTREYWATEIGAGLYRPLTLLSFAIDWARRSPCCGPAQSESTGTAD